MIEIQELLKKGELDKALEFSLKKYQETKDEKIYNLYGIALFKKKLYNESAQVFGELYSKHPENEKLLINYAQALIEAGRVEEAERVVREGAMIFPESSKLLELLAECERRKGLREQQKKTEEEHSFEDITEISEIQEKEEEQEVKYPEPEELLEKVEEIKEEIETPFEDRRKTESYETENEKISLEQNPELPDGFLRRARIIELSLFGESDFIARTSFILSVSGMYKVFPLKERQGNKLKNSLFGGKEHSFVRIRGERLSVIIGGEYISFIDISELGKFAVLEPYLVGFEPRIQYNVVTTKIKKVGKINIVELTGQGKVLIFSAGKKFILRNFEDKIRVSTPNFVGLYGEGEIDFLHDSVQIRGSGKIVIRI
ncbi:MAG: tetratricopeptide repeat protein [Candidatus Calescibacterium sp.]|nr:tetratricopeptide repeat protein [Candidatus Calescibacterium sp.]MCX7734419.1 tetratricopeptide repeat protein [bacterium]MDW8086815.1 tetratricopeptide repeat protein [Candidatus Calescibacterium sp.]